LQKGRLVAYIDPERGEDADPFAPLFMFRSPISARDARAPPERFNGIGSGTARSEH
jgi:hypothetical protein